jgi:uncharacterized coiled-coil protein SlyX
MSLERVIAEQQATIDRMEATIQSQTKSLDTVWTQHDELFECIARFLDTDLPDSNDLETCKRFGKARWDVRMKLSEIGYCPDCYSFLCECNYD